MSYDCAVVAMDLFSLTVFNTNLGWMGVVGSSSGLRKIILPQKSKEAVISHVKDWGSGTIECGDSALFDDLPHRLRSYLKGKAVDFPDKLDLAQATRFQQDVWQITRTVPYGETRSYAWVANKSGLPRAARAVGQALARNPLPIIIPCHRVIGSHGGLGGFSGGVEVKRYLLNLEVAYMEEHHVLSIC